MRLASEAGALRLGPRPHPPFLSRPLPMGRRQSPGRDLAPFVSACLSFDAFDNAQVPINGVPEYAQCLLIRSAVMRGDRLRDAIKLDEDDALLKPTFIDARGQAACQEAAARALQRRASKPGVCSEGLLITYRAVRRNPKCFSHSFDE